MQFEIKDEDTQIPFDQNKQMALVGHLMQREEFFRQVYRKLKAEWFSEPFAGTIFQYYCNFWETRGRTPLSVDEFKDWQDFTFLDQQKRLMMFSKITMCHTLTAKYGFDGLAAQLTGWQKMQIFRQNLPQMANLLNSHKISEAEHLLSSTTRSIVEARFEGDPEVDWTDWRKIRDQSILNLDGALSTGLAILDRKLLSEGTKGSLLPGDTTIILAPTNSGKTSVMLTIGRHNFFAGKSIMIITREGNEQDFMTKTYQSVFKKTRKELWAWSHTPEGEAQMDKLTLMMKHNLTYVHMPKIDTYCEDVIADVVRRQIARKARFGKGYDMLIVDYPGIFKSSADHVKWEYRQQMDDIYRQFVQLGVQEKFHVLAAAQTNREGSKINKGYLAKRLLSFEDVGETFGISQSATNIITINRDVQSQASNLITFHLAKSRSEETGWAVTAKSDFSRCITHSDEFTATAYRGDNNMEGMLEALVKEYPNKDIPEGYRKPQGSYGQN